MEDKRLKHVMDMERERRELEHTARVEERKHEKWLMRIVMEVQQGMVQCQQFQPMQQ